MVRGRSVAGQETGVSRARRWRRIRGPGARRACARAVRGLRVAWDAGPASGRGADREGPIAA
ncbi:hypothetical protein GCM10010269_18630 [Streptomyces humidus]|uniref:Uncharacterized protein n=1 Tax=Streptomyces humidus TaxID=52259 RepID=A0A918FUE4_9ACTN|nr:hypothetical protein GCM10010269_18630 [Streptomyces humidus]